jgi:Rieske Fe-S protein
MSDRRSFLKLVSTLAGTITAALAAIPALISFGTPVLRRNRQEAWIKLGTAGKYFSDEPVKADFAVTMRDAWVESRSLQSVWVRSDDGEHFTIFDSRCTHLGCPYDYDREAKAFRCPCHLGRFDARTGDVLGGPPPRPLKQLQSKVEDGDLYVLMGSAT